MAQSVARQWPALPDATPESLQLWAKQITRLLQEGAIANGAQIDELDDLFLTPAEGDAAYVNVAGDTMTGLLTVQRDVSGNASHFQATSADAGADYSPQFKATRASPSPAAGDLIGRFVCQGKDSGGNDTLYAYIQARIDDPTDGSEDSSLLAGRMVGGVEVAELIQTAGKQSIWVPAAAFSVLGGASSGSLNVGGAAVAYRAFDPTSVELDQFTVAMPQSWDAGNLTAEFYWTHPATVTNFGVVWQFAAGAYGDNVALANVFVAANTTDTGGVTSNIYRSPETGAVNPGNTQAKKDLLVCYAARISTDGADTLAVDAYLIGVMLHYTTNAPNDA